MGVVGFGVGERCEGGLVELLVAAIAALSWSIVCGQRAVKAAKTLMALQLLLQLLDFQLHELVGSNLPLQQLCTFLIISTQCHNLCRHC